MASLRTTPMSFELSPEQRSHLTLRCEPYDPAVHPQRYHQDTPELARTSDFDDTATLLHARNPRAALLLLMDILQSGYTATLLRDPSKPAACLVLSSTPHHQPPANTA